MTKKIILLTLLTGIVTLTFVFIFKGTLTPTEKKASLPAVVKPQLSHQKQEQANQVNQEDVKLENENLPVETESNTETGLSDENIEKKESVETEIDTSDWETYRNEEYGYEIQYPNDWIVDLKYESVGTLFFRTKRRQDDIDAKKPVRIFDVSIKIHNSTQELLRNQDKKLSFQDWLKENFDMRNSIIVDGNVGYQGFSSSIYEEFSDEITLIESQGKIYEIRIDGSETEKIPLKTKKMISTFKFIQKDQKNLIP